MEWAFTVVFLLVLANGVLRADVEAKGIDVIVVGPEHANNEVVARNQELLLPLVPDIDFLPLIRVQLQLPDMRVRLDIRLIRDDVLVVLEEEIRVTDVVQL